MELISKEQLLRTKLLHFYADPKNLNIFLPIILQKTRLSLRSLDWFVTNYCKKYNISYSQVVNGNTISYFPFKAYKCQLKAYSKKYCDPFCRRERILFDYKNNHILNLNELSGLGHTNYVITTIGQLNFFKFAIQENLIMYAIEHIKEIEIDMNQTLKTREQEKKFMKVESIKRKELSKAGNKSVCVTRISAVIQFT
jgi:hypothetical protein